MATILIKNFSNEDIIKRRSSDILNHKENIKRMKKQDEATHKLFESLKKFGKE